MALAYKLTSKYREFNKTANFQNCSAELEELIDLFINSKLDDFIKVGRTLINWKNEIINSLTYISTYVKNTKEQLYIIDKNAYLIKLEAKREINKYDLLNFN